MTVETISLALVVTVAILYYQSTIHAMIISVMDLQKELANKSKITLILTFSVENIKHFDYTNCNNSLQTLTVFVTDVGISLPLVLTITFSSNYQSTCNDINCNEQSMSRPTN